jgi:hypothetical protein
MSRRPRSRFDRFGWVGAAIGAAIVLGACNSAASPAGTTGTSASQPAPTQVVTPTSAAASEPETSLPEVTAVPTSVDPCQVVTQSEASTLAGTTFGAGVSTTTSGNAKICTYGGQTLNVLNVDVALAPDQATIDAGEAEVEAQLEQSVSEGLTKTDLTGIGDKAVYLAASKTISGQTISVAAIYVVKGLTFLAISDVVAGAPAPTSAALQAQATTSLSRLP